MKYLLTLSLFLLSACAGEHPSDTLYKGLMGKSIYYADERFGSALRIVDYTNDPKQGPIRFAEWGFQGTRMISMPTSQTTFGQFGGQSFNSTTYGSQSQIIPASCDLKIYYPTKTKIIGHVEAVGNGCDYYSKRLR